VSHGLAGPESVGVDGVEKFNRMSDKKKPLTVSGGRVVISNLAFSTDHPPEYEGESVERR